MKKLMGTYLFCRLQSDFKHTQKRLVWLELPKKDIVSAAAKDAKDAKETPKQDENLIDRNKAEYKRFASEISGLVSKGTSIDEIRNVIQNETQKISQQIIDSGLTKAEQKELMANLHSQIAGLNNMLTILAEKKSEEVKTETKDSIDKVIDWAKDLADVMNNPISAVAGGIAGIAAGAVTINPAVGAAVAAGVYGIGATIEGEDMADTETLTKKESVQSPEKKLAEKKEEAKKLIESSTAADQREAGMKLMKSVEDAEKMESKMVEAKATALSLAMNIEFKDAEAEAIAKSAIIAAYMVDGKTGAERMADKFKIHQTGGVLDDQTTQEDVGKALTVYGVDLQQYEAIDKEFPNIPAEDKMAAVLALKNAKGKLSDDEYKAYVEFLNSQFTKAAKEDNKTSYGGDNAFMKEILSPEEFQKDPNANEKKREALFKKTLAEFSNTEALKDPKLFEKVRQRLVSLGFDSNKIIDDTLKEHIKQMAESHKTAEGTVKSKVQTVLGKYKKGSKELRELLENAKKNNDPGAKETVGQEIVAALGDTSQLPPGQYQVDGITITVSENSVSIDTSKWNEKPTAAPSGAPSSPGGGRGGMGRKKGKEKGPKGKEVGGAVAVSTPSKVATDLIERSANIPGMKLDSPEAVAGMLNGTPKDSLNAAAKRDLEKGFTVGSYRASWNPEKGQFVAEGSNGSPSDKTKKKETSA